MDEDLELISRTRAGDREAFNGIVLKYQRPLYALLYRMVSSHDDAAELLQKTFVRAFAGLGSFEHRASFKSWLYQIAINLAKNVYRDRARAAYVPVDDIVISQEPRALEGLIRTESAGRLRRALAELPEKQRITVMLRVQEEKKFDEIAEVMGCTTGTAKANYHHGVKKLKTLLAEAGDAALQNAAGAAGKRE